MEGMNVGEAFITLRFRSDGVAEVSRQAEAELGASGTNAGKAFSENWAKSASALGTKLTRTVTLPILAGFAVALHEAEQSITVGAQTEAVIKSTGGAANVTATAVGNLANALSRKTAIDDENIQSGENLLLTFRDVRNEAGRGNDIFTQATKVALDMSTAMGTDLNGSVIQIGKALQDPILGLTALRRVGVGFTQDQKEQIKTLVETGDKMGAQKIILAELTAEFGGSAAKAKTPLKELELNVKNTAESIGLTLQPAVKGLGAGVGFLGDAFSGLPDIGQTFVVGALGAAAMLGPVLKLTGNVGTLFAKLAEGGPVMQGVGTGLKGLGAAAGIAGGIFVLVGVLDSLDHSAENFHKTVESMSKLKTDALVAQFDKLASTQAKVADGFENMPSAEDKAAASLDIFRTVAETNIGTAQRLVAQMDANGEKTGKYHAILDDLARGQKQANSDTDAGSKAVDGLSASYGGATDAADMFKTKLDELAGATTGQETATIAYKNSSDKLNQALIDNGATLDINTQKGRDNRSAILDTTGSAFALAEAMIKTSGDTAGANFVLQAHVGQLTDVMRQSGMTEAQIQAYLYTLGLTPAQISTLINADDQASPKAQGVWSMMDRLNGKTATVSVIMDTVRGNWGWAATGAVFKGGVRTMASGGFGDRQAQVAKAGNAIIWGEGKDDESYIPWNNNPRSVSILEQTATALGFRLTPMAEGGTGGSAGGHAGAVSVEVASAKLDRAADAITEAARALVEGRPPSPREMATAARIA